jgi:hypothetical protein
MEKRPVKLNPNFSNSSNNKKGTSSNVKNQNSLSRMRQIYASRDGRLGVYQDADGHLVAADMSKFSS